MSKRFLIVFMVVVISLSRCSPAHPVPPAVPVDLVVPPMSTSDIVIHGDDRFKFEERLLIEKACNEVAWRSSGHSVFRMVWDWTDGTFLSLVDRPHMVRVSITDMKVTVLDTHFHGRVLGYVHEKEVGIIVDRCLELYPVVLHELWHLAGLDHTPTPGGLMSEVRASSRWTTADQEWCVTSGMCD